MVLLEMEPLGATSTLGSTRTSYTDGADYSLAAEARRAASRARKLARLATHEFSTPKMPSTLSAGRSYFRSLPDDQGASRLMSPRAALMCPISLTWWVHAHDTRRLG